VEAPFLTRGARQAEQLLCEQLLAEMTQIREQPALLKQPVWVLVPSRELRDHLVGVLATAGCALGVEVLSLHAAAIRLHQAKGVRAQSHSLPVELLARRAAEKQAVLRAQLGALQDGMGLAASAIRDVLSARAEAGEHPVQLAAQQVRERMSQLELSRPGDLQEAAADFVTDCNPARAVWVYGFADATGQACQLLRAFLNHGARLVLDLPVDPAAPAQEDRGAAFARRFAQRLGFDAAQLEGFASIDAPALASQWRQFHASGAEDEVRAVAQEIRRQLDSGVQADQIGVVVRQFEPYAVSFRRWFTELGIPFRSKLAPAALFPAHRRLRAALDVLRLGSQCPIDRWLDASPLGRVQERLHDLRLVFRSLSLARLGQAASFDEGRALAGEQRFQLPIRSGLVDVAIGSDSDEAEEQSFLPFDTEQRARSRSIPAGPLLAAFGAIRSLLRELREWPKEQSVAQHAASAQQWIQKTLAWRSESLADEDDWLACLQEVARSDIGPVSRTEFLMLLDRQATEFGARTLGGQSGVAVLDVTQARARSFEQLFILGMNRGVFPRTVRQDPILPDRQRRKLIAGGASDLALAEFGHEEERYLFAQLCGAADSICLSWQRSDAAGKELPPSPFMQRLWLSDLPGRGESAVARVPRLREQLYAQRDDLRAGFEWLSYFGLLGDLPAWNSVLPHVLQRGVLGTSESLVAAAVAARVANLRAVEAPRPDPEQALVRSPWSGQLAQSLAQAEGSFVTALEAYAACPWQSFLARRLGVEAPPDPMAQLPEIDAALVGSTVHAALESLVAAGKTLGGEARRVAQPDPAAIGAATVRAATEVAEGAQIYMVGLQSVLAERARPFVEKAIDWEFRDHQSIDVLACEVRHELSVDLPSGGKRRVRFIADRVDQTDEGWVFTDYKTSKPLSSAAKLATRMKHLHQKIVQGSKLQAGAYAASAPGAIGRYLFLKSKAAHLDESADLQLDSEANAAALQSFHQTAGKILQSQEAGIAFARFELSGGASNPACQYCDLADACHRFDSSMRRAQVSQHQLEVDATTLELWALSDAKVEDPA